MKKGFVYIMSISDRPGIIKIGRTEKHPEHRAIQLSNQTASTGEFKLKWFKEVENHEFVESFLHFVFREFNIKKEYFNIDLELALELANQSISYFIEIDKNLKSLFLGKVDFMEKRIKALEISQRIKGDIDKVFIQNSLDSLNKQLEQIKKMIQ